MGGYLGFNSTGVKEVDSILFAIVNAGDGYHNTSQWGESENGDKSYIDLIQESANKCANKIKTLTSDNSDYAKCADDIVKTMFPSDKGILRKAFEEILRKHFA